MKMGKGYSSAPHIACVSCSASTKPLSPCSVHFPIIGMREARLQYLCEFGINLPVVGRFPVWSSLGGSPYLTDKSFCSSQ